MANPFEMQESTLDSTIDESVWESIKRDIVQVGRRLKLVILPGLSTVRARPRYSIVRCSALRRD